MTFYKPNPRPRYLTPYERLRWQQGNCTEDIGGYAVAIANEKTKRAAYMTGAGTEITNNETKAAVLPKTDASTLMTRLRTGRDECTAGLYKIAFLVPVSDTLPVTLCTFSGF